MKIDPITLEVIRNKLDAIANEMQMSVMKSAYSPIVKESQDTTQAIFTPNGDTVSQAMAMPLFLGTLFMATKRIVSVFPPHEMKEGDIFIMNDPYDGGTHIPDNNVVTPVICKGEVVALCGSVLHNTDMGGIDLGSLSSRATEIFQEGLRIPILKLYDQGKPNDTLFKIWERNVRMPDLCFGDLRAQIAGNEVGKKRIIAIIEEYGKEVFFEAIRELFDMAERWTRKKIEEIPDGVYRFHDYWDADSMDPKELVKIAVTVTIQGSNVTVDFEGTDPQIKNPWNCTPPGVYAATYCAIKSITDPAIPNNGGCIVPITIKIPLGTILNPLPPAPVALRVLTIKRTEDVVLGALAKVLPGKIPACECGNCGPCFISGRDPHSGKYFRQGSLHVGGWGARPDKDGIDYLDFGVTNVDCTTVEANELDDLPKPHVRWLQNRLWTDSGGAGKYRGGLGVHRVFKLLHGEGQLLVRDDRHKTPAWGLYGGCPGKKWKTILIHADGTQDVLSSRYTGPIREGDEVHIFAGGGGGYGDPLEREPRMILDDVLNRKVSIEAGERDYGVAIDAEAMIVNVERTRKRREEIARERGPITWTYDRGELLGKE